MKQGIHPKYYKAKIHCGTCGTEFEVGSTRESLRVDTAGQVERFQRRLDRAQSGR
jgi:large subunit ribosomal protein L31